MMRVVDTENWEDFKKQLQEVRQAHASGGGPEGFLFRGLADSTWELTTTLERAGQEGKAISEYYWVISRLKPEVESFTESRWGIRELPEIQRLLKEYDPWASHIFPNPSEYSYMVYLRHHGFPSPLLDWSRSAYVAAFFAFRSAVKPREGRVSIFAFLETLNGFKVTGSLKPQVRRCGAFVNTHRRHFLQQCDYTMCATYRDVGGSSYEWQFAKHGDVLRQDLPNQDVLWRFDIPWAERLRVLRLLDECNLNAFSLFESEETLMETLRVRALEFPGHGSTEPAP